MNKRIFIACDTNNVSTAKKIIQNSKTKQIKIGYKFGLEFFSSKNGRSFISKLKNKIIFADLKLNDIPNTCKSTVKALKDLKLNYLTIHISSGFQALKSVKKISGKIKIVGVTTLTSLDEKSLKETGHKRNLKNLVLHQARLANKAKLDALVCSANEVKIVKKVFKKEIITPGIRLPNDKKGDQKRVMTPREAIQNGATSLVMGRSITRGNIKNNIKKIIKELS